GSGKREGRHLRAAYRAEIAPAADALILRLLEVRLFGEVLEWILGVGPPGAHREPDMVPHAIEVERAPRMRGHLPLTEIDLEEVYPLGVHAHGLAGVERVAAQLERSVRPGATRLPVHQLQPIGRIPVAEVRRGEDLGALELEGPDVLDEHPAVGGGGLDVGEEREPVEVPEAADHVVADGLPLRIADGRRVLVLEETRALGILAIDAVPRALPLPA